MPDLIRHLEALEKTGFRLEFVPMKIGAGMTPFMKNQSLWTDNKELRTRSRFVWGTACEK